jgi:hypothetical protein
MVGPPECSLRVVSEDVSTFVGILGVSSVGRESQGIHTPVLRLADLEVRIPRLEILALERLADRDGKSVDAVLARELLDVVSAHSEYLATAIPGFTAALRWPQ